MSEHFRICLSNVNELKRVSIPFSFIEFGMLNYSDNSELEVKSPADGMVSGLAKINGRQVVVPKDLRKNNRNRKEDDNEGVRNV